MKDEDRPRSLRQRAPLALGLLLAAGVLAAYDDARGHGAGTFPGEPLLLGFTSVAMILGLSWVGRRLLSKRGAA